MRKAEQRMRVWDPRVFTCVRVNKLIRNTCICLGSEWGVTGVPMLLQPSWHDVVPAAVTADQAVSHPPPTKLEELQRNLKSGWTVHIAQDGRLYYCKWATTFVVLNLTAVWVWCCGVFMLYTLMDGTVSLHVMHSVHFGWKYSVKYDSV